MKRSLASFLLALLLGPIAHAAEHLPASLFFVANEGQWEEPFAFKAAVGNAIYYVTPSGMTIDNRQYERTQRARDPMDGFEMRHEPEPVNVRGHVLKMNFVNANARPEIIGEEKLSSYSNYFIGRDSCKWRSFVGHYQTVRMKNVWPGIDVEYRIQPEGIETVYRVQAGADASQIMVQYEGLDAPLRTDGQGNLLLQTSLGTIKEKAPFAYQIADHRQVEVPVRFQVLANDKYSLSFEAFDATREVVIDPLVYSTFFGGNGYNDTYAIAVDENGNILVCGDSDASNFPVTAGAYQTQYRGFFWHGTVSKFTPDGRSLLFSTYLSGDSATPNDGVTPYCVLADGNNAIYVVGYLTSGMHGFPLTADAFDTAMGGGEGFVSRLSASGTSLEFSSYLGGSQEDGIWSLQIDASGFVYVAGRTWSTDFPVTPNAMYGTLQNNGCPFVSVIDPANSTLIYSTFFPGATTEENMCLQSPMRVWLYGTTYDYTPTTPDALQPTPETRFNGYLSLLDLSADQLIYSTYFGGHGRTEIKTLVPDGSNAIRLAGWTESLDFPVTPDAFDTIHGWGEGFLTNLAWPNTIVNSTFYRDAFVDYILKESNGSVVGCGGAGSGMPTTPDGFDTTYNGVGDIFLCRFSPDLTRLEYGTFLGGDQGDVNPDMVRAGENSYWVCGSTFSLNFPTTPDAFQRFSPSGGYFDGFISHFVLPPNDVVGRPQVSLPGAYQLSAFPNPFNSATLLSFSLAATSVTSLRLYDMMGRVVLDQALGTLTSGAHQVRLDMSRFASGSYLARLETPQHSAVTKIVLLR